MILSPIQFDDVSRGALFDDLRSCLEEDFDMTNTHIDAVEKKVDGTERRMDLRFVEQKSYMDDGFNKVFEQIDAVETNLGGKIDNLTGEVKLLTKAVNSVTDQVKLLTKIVTDSSK